MKVKVLDNESSTYRGHIHYDGVIYKTGAVLTIRDKDFDPTKFVKVGKSPKKEEPKQTTEQVPQPNDVLPSTIEPVDEELAKTTKRKRRV